MNGEQVMVWKECVVANLKALSWPLLEETEVTM
jgi:hypothetical protein